MQVYVKKIGVICADVREQRALKIPIHIHVTHVHVIARVRVCVDVSVHACKWLHLRAHRYAWNAKKCDATR